MLASDALCLLRRASWVPQARFLDLCFSLSQVFMGCALSQEPRLFSCFPEASETDYSLWEKRSSQREQLLFSKSFIVRERLDVLGHLMWKVKDWEVAWKLEGHGIREALGMLTSREKGSNTTPLGWRPCWLPNRTFPAQVMYTFAKKEAS